MKVFAFDAHHLDPVATFETVQHLPYSLFLDSADKDHYNARYSYIACFPMETIESKGGRTMVTSAQIQTSRDEDPFAIVQERMSAHNMSTQTLSGIPPFQGGAAGLFGYDLARRIEKLPSTAKDTPGMIEMGVGLYDKIIAFDHEADKAWIVVQAENKAQADKKYQFVQNMITQSPQTKGFTAEDLEWDSNFSQASYEEMVGDVVQHIKQGDIFQANLSQRFDAKLPHNFCAFSHYKRLRTVNAAPFASYMNLGPIKISSASPEQFLNISTNGTVETRPIKGTIKRSADPAEDKFIKNTLENSEKDRAENTMIVDLMRNDLSKVCEADSIEVTKLCEIESFARVHHLVSTVKGALREDMAPLDLLRACFPGGSITGAPKIKAMEIIDTLEPTRRGPYCGSVGYIGSNSTLDSNILIRTLVYQQSYGQNTVSFQAGGGIVYDSNPAAEYQETLTKAEAIFESFAPDTATTLRATRDSA